MYGETGRFALYIYRQISIIKYWFKLISSHDSLMYSLYNLKSNNGAFTNSWTNNVHNLLRELGLHYMIDKNIVSRVFRTRSITQVTNISIVQNQFLLRTICI